MMKGNAFYRVVDLEDPVYVPFLKPIKEAR